MTPFLWDHSLLLVLASASPQRQAILEQLGIAFDVRPTHVEELEEGEPAFLAAENARRKAAAGRAALDDGERDRAVVLACDTVVALEGRVYGKPAEPAQARAFIADLAGATHEVLGALAVALPDGRILERTDVTRVTFAPLDRRPGRGVRRDRRMGGPRRRLCHPAERRCADRGHRRRLPQRRRAARPGAAGARARARAPVLNHRPPLHWCAMRPPAPARRAPAGR